jgi:hypothetical protein
LENAPEPADAVFSRTMAAVTAASPRVHAATPWWPALAGPARLAAAAAIVIVGGTIAFGTVKATRERVVATDGATAARVTLDRVPQHEQRLARSAAIQIVVRDVASAARRISELAQHEDAAVMSEQLIGAAHHPPARARIVLRVRANRLDATMVVISELGRVDSRSIETSDLTRALDDNAAALRRAASSARATPRGSAMNAEQATADEADVTRLIADRSALERRIAMATLAIVLRAENPGRSALSATPGTIDEPLPGSLRRTCSLLARGSSFAPHDTELAGRRLWPFDLAASRILAAASHTGRTPTGRNDRTDRV